MRDVVSESMNLPVAGNSAGVPQVAGLSNAAHIFGEKSG